MIISCKAGNWNNLNTSGNFPETYLCTITRIHVRTLARISGTVLLAHSHRKLLNSMRTMQFKGCGMGPWLVLVSPCFRENIVDTCKIGSFLCSLDTLLQKNVIFLLFGNQISKWCSFEKKRAIFDVLFTFSSHQGKVTKIPSAHISNTYIHIFCSPY